VTAGSAQREITMAKRDKSSTKKGKPISSPDELVKPGKEGDVELTADELKKVSGGFDIEQIRGR
jgi:hypothetical protein